MSASLVRPEDLFARYGGEEFTLVLRDTDAARAVVLAERLAPTIEQTGVVFGGVTIRVTSSCGIAGLDECERARQGDGHAHRRRAPLPRQAEGRNRVVGPR